MKLPFQRPDAVWLTLKKRMPLPLVLVFAWLRPVVLKQMNCHMPHNETSPITLKKKEKPQTNKPSRGSARVCLQPGLCCFCSVTSVEIPAEETLWK